MKNKKILNVFSILVFVFCCLFVTSCKGCKGCNKECEHQWSEWQTVNTPTCMVEGLKERTCSECGETESQKIEKVGHSFTNYVADGKVADCINYTKTATCDFDGCNQKNTITVNSTKDHNFVEIENKPADCENDGYKVFECDGCGEKHEELVSLSSGHNVSSWTMVSEVKKEGTTCEYVQTYEGYCSNCKQNIQKEDSVFKHTLEVRVTCEASCVESGVKELYCTEDGCNYTKEEEYDAPHAHSYGEGVLEGVVTKYTCTNGCGHFKTTIVAKEEVQTEISKEDLSGNSVELKNAEIALDTDTLDGLESADITLGADVLDSTTKETIMNSLTEEQKEQIGDNTIYNFTMKQGEDEVANFDGFVTITIPYTLAPGENPENIAIWYVSDDGSLETIETTYANGFVTFKTNHFSYYTVTRLTPKERCALYGHIHVEIQVDPTCTKDGYVLNVCQRCGESTKVISKAFGHDYKHETVDATCKKEGSITHTCNTCKFSYVEIIPTLSHEFKEVERVEATTTKEGYVKYECILCGDTKQEVLPKIEEILGDLTVIEVLNKTLSNFDFSNIVLKITDFKGSIVSQRYIINSSYVYPTDDVSFEIAEMYLGLDSNNNLIGNGTVTVNLNQGNLEQKMDIDAYLYNGVFYGISNSKIEGIDEGSSYIKVDLAGFALTDIEIFEGTKEDSNEIGFDSLLAGLNGFTGKNFESFADIEQYLKDLTVWCEENVVPFIEKLELDEIDKFGKDLIEKLLTLKETTDGYQISVNSNILNEVYDYLTNTYIYDILVELFGNKVLENIDLVLDFNVGKLIEFVESKGFVLSEAVEIIDGLLQYVLETEEVSLNAMLGQFMEDPEFDIIEFINSDQIKGVSVKQLIENYAGVEVEELKTNINQMLETFKETKLVDLIPLENASSMITLIEDYISLLCSSFTFNINIDKYFEINNVNFKVELEQNDDNKDLLPEGYQANCNLELLFNVSSYQISTNVKSELDQLYTDIILNIDIETIMEAEFRKVEGWEIEYVYNGGILEKIIASNLVKKQIDSGNDSITYYCYEKTTEIYAADIYDALQTTYWEKCNNWYDLELTIAVKTNRVEKEVVVPKDVNEETYTQETIINQETEYETLYLDFWYNTVTKETMTPQKTDSWEKVEHNFVVNKVIGATECGEYTITFKSCSICGHEEVGFERKYHEFYFEDIELHGLSCEDGYDYVIKCNSCDLVLEGYGNDHYQIQTYHDLSDFGATCEGHLVNDTCACGQNAYVYINGSCDFDHHSNIYDYEDYEILFAEKQVSDYDTYVCAVTDPKCGFRYSRISYYEQDPTHPCIVKNYTVYYIGHSATKLADAKETITISHGGYSLRHDWTYETIGNQEIQSCINCDAKEIYEYKDFTHGEHTINRIVFEREENIDPFRPSWVQWEYSYSFEPTCVQYVTYTSSDGDEHSYFNDDCRYEHILIQEGSCTQDRIYASKCFICGNNSDSNWMDYPNGHHYVYNAALDMFECKTCGIKNVNGADGAIILEDASDIDDDPDTLIVGYYNPKEIEYTLNITLIMKNPENSEFDQYLIVGVEIDKLPYGRYVSFSKSEVEELAKTLDLDPSEYNIRLSFVPVNYEDDLDYAITFE